MHGVSIEDRDFVRVLLAEWLADAGTLRERIEALPVDAEAKERLGTWVRVTAAEL